MSDSQRPCDIRTAFPLIPEDRLVGLIAGLSPHESISSLLDSADATVVFKSIADWMLRKPSTCIVTILPGLWLARDQKVQLASFPVKMRSVLMRSSLTVWGEVLEMAPLQLLNIHGFGERSVQLFLAVAAKTSAEACSRETPPEIPPTPEMSKSQCLLQQADSRINQLRRLADWAANEANALTVNDLIVSFSQPHVPDDIVQLHDLLRATSLADLFPGIYRQETLESLVDDLFGVLGSRRQIIFRGRISLKHHRTLEDLGTVIGVTRERVRQLSERAEKIIRKALTTPRFAPIIWRAQTLRTKLGAAVPGNTPHFDEATRYVTRGVSDAAQERVLDLLLWLAGPYSFNSIGWLQVTEGEVPGPGIIGMVSDERGRVDMRCLQEHLTRSGLLPQIQPFWRDQIGKIRNVDGIWLLWAGAVPDKAARILEIWGQPATPEEIVNAIGDGNDVRGVWDRLIADARFMRVDMTRVGLRSWGLEEYLSIVEEIDRELDRRGGTADLGDLIGTLVARFDLREKSIRSLCNAAMFVLEGATLRRRTSADTPHPVPPITETAGCHLLGPDTLAWRVEVTPDTLRGSGRSMPAPIAVWLGVAVGGQRSLTADGGAVRVTWPETSATGPGLGSIRLLVERVGGQVGDQVLLCFRRDEGTVGLTRMEPII